MAAPVIEDLSRMPDNLTLRRTGQFDDSDPQNNGPTIGVNSASLVRVVFTLPPTGPYTFAENGTRRVSRNMTVQPPEQEVPLRWTLRKPATTPVETPLALTVEASFVGDPEVVTRDKTIRVSVASSVMAAAMKAAKKVMAPIKTPLKKASAKKKTEKKKTTTMKPPKKKTTAKKAAKKKASRKAAKKK